jgi:hypothetical protein
MAGAGGRDVHPRSTHGVLIRVYPDNSAPTEGEHKSLAPGLSGIARVIVATSDAATAAAAYGQGFGLDVGPVVIDDRRGVRSVECRPPKGGLIELVSVADHTRPFADDIKRFVTERGEGMYALVLHATGNGTSANLSAAAVLGRRGVAFSSAAGSAGGPEAIWFGTRFVIAQPTPGSDHSSASAMASSAIRSSS